MKEFNNDLQDVQLNEVTEELGNKTENMNQLFDSSSYQQSRQMKFTDKISNQTHNLNNMNYSKAKKK